MTNQRNPRAVNSNAKMSRARKCALLLFLLGLLGSNSSTAYETDKCVSVFEGSSGAFDYAAEKAINTESQDIFSGTVIRSIPRDRIDKLFEDLFDALFTRRQNTQSYSWSFSERDNRNGAALGHIVSCSAEQLVGSGNRRKSLCSAKIKHKPRAHSNNFSSLILVNPSSEEESFGSLGCWCQGGCKENRESLPGGIERVVVKSPEEDDKLNISQKEITLDQFERSLITGEAPVGIGLFSATADTRTGRRGDVFRSQRILYTNETERDLVRRPDSLETAVVARTLEEIILTLERTLDSTLQFEPAKGSAIVLAVAAALTAILFFDSKGIVKGLCGRVHKLISHLHRGAPDIAGSDRERALRRERTGIKVAIGIILILFEMCIELLPIYYLLYDEVRARHHEEVVGVEILGTGFATEYFQGSGPEIFDASSAIVLIVCRNTSDSTELIAVLAAILTLISTYVAARGVIRTLKNDQSN